MSDLGTEIEFADGKRVVDSPFVPSIMQATDGKPERFTFKDAMQLANKSFGQVTGKDLMKRAGVGDHLRRYGI
jgi:hypothetical protein